MTPTQQERRIQALYDDANVSRRNLCERVVHLEADIDGMRELARWMYQVMDESCAVHYPYEPLPVSIHALMRAEKELEALGIEV